jgi:hypothetical protein
MVIVCSRWCIAYGANEMAMNVIIRSEERSSIRIRRIDYSLAFLKATKKT